MTRAARAAFVVAVAATVVGLSKVHAAWVADPAYDYTGSFRFGWSLALIAVTCVVAYGVGLPDLPRSRRTALGASAAAAGLSAIGLSVVQLLTGDALLPRFVVLTAAVLTVPIGVATNALARRGPDRAGRRDRAVLVGPVHERDALVAELGETPHRPATVAGHVELEEAGRPGSRALREVIGGTGATVVVLDREAQADDRIVAQVAAFHERGVRVRTLVQFYEEWLGKLPVSELERASLFFDIGELHRARYGRSKRVLDVALGLLGAVAFAALVPVVALANLAANRGPLLYRQQRIGRFGEPFTIWKLRTMRPQQGGALVDEWTTRDDPRVTPFGRVLRATHLDELPQVLNVVRGDLSIVGPRPEQPHYVEELTEKLPFYGLRHLVRPGITGWAQVMYGYAGDERDALEKLQYEFFYLRHQGTRLDLQIVGRTIRSVFGSQGRGR